MNKNLPENGLTRENLLGIPLRIGILELSAFFQKLQGQILECTKEKFVAVLDTFHAEVTIDAEDSNKVLARFFVDGDAAKPPRKAVVTSDGRNAKVVAENGSTVSISYLEDGSYTFLTSKFPITVSGKFVD